MKNILRIAAFLMCLTSQANAARAETASMALGTGVDPAFATAYVAQSMGIFKRNGLDVKLNTGPSGSAMVSYLVKNQSQAAIAAEQAGITNFNLDPNVVLVGETAAADDWWGVVGRDTPGLADLKGKRIGVSLGSGSEVFWNAIIKRFSLDPKDYTIVNVEPPEMVAALSRRDIDAFVCWEPWLSRAVKSVPNTKVLRNNVGIMLPRAILYVNRGWAQDNPKAAELFVRSLVEATDVIHNDPGAAAKVVSTFLKLDLEETKVFLTKITFGVRLDDATLNHMHGVEAELRRTGRLTKPVDWKAFVYPDLLRKVAPAAVTVKD
ncbi:MAG: ABC transporter substrate-binding protein [Beijerinckiaceae bacterium]|nr:ABC transporter substrate-binding protein [Beijerinckiaceae bacterium]